MHLLITGTCGFIGSHLARRFLNNAEPRYANWRVTSLDALTYAGNLRTIADFRDHPRHRFVRGDIADAAFVDGLFAEGRFDAVIHLAAESHVDRSIESAAPFIRTNVLGTQTLLDAARRHGVKRFVQVSTAEVYGSLELGGADRFTEDSPLHPNSPYAASKAAADLLALAAWHTHGQETIITRCSNNYGPFQFPEKVIPLMTLNAMRGESLPVYGDGLNVRDWIFVEDHCAGIAAALERGRPGEVYNFGADNERPNIELVRMILRLLGKPESLIRFVKDRPGHDRRYAIDASKARRELQWAPAVEFEEGMRRTLAWYEENRAWWQEILSGEYQQYYERMYGQRG